MAYATQTDLVPNRLTEVELSELTNDAGGEIANAALVTSMLKEASALVDSYARQRYAVPLQPSAQVTSLTISIALYKLFLRRRRVTDAIRQEYDDAITFLKDVSTGRAGLDQPVAAAPQDGGGGAVATKKEERFSDEYLGGWV